MKTVIEILAKNIIILLILAVLFVSLLLLTNEFYQNGELSKIKQNYKQYNDYCFED